MIRVEAGTAFATVQDQGWPRGRAVGLPRSGALDSRALALANSLVGNPPTAAGLEITAGRLALRFEQAATIAAAGARPAATLAGRPLLVETTVTVLAGETLMIDPVRDGRFLYLAIRGGVSVAPLLGSRSTYLPTGFGGYRGRVLRAGDVLPIGTLTELPCPPLGYTAPPIEQRSGPIAIVPGPQIDLFAGEAQARLASGTFTVSRLSDRMGTRLAGQQVRPERDARLPSEGTCLGAMQIPDDGQPIVVLADGPTVGGYPKIGAIAGVDLARFVQTPIGGTVRFEWVGIGDAQRALYALEARLASRMAAIRSAAF